jgi:hypothetical protein
MPYSRTLKDLREKQEAGPYHSFFAQKKNTLQIIYKNTDFFGGGGINYSRIFVFREKQRMAWEHKLKHTIQILSRLAIRKHAIQILPHTAYFEFCTSGDINCLTSHKLLFYSS